MTDEELDKLTDNALDLMRNENTEHLNDKEWQKGTVMRVVGTYNINLHYEKI